jgi:hypothetical protein
MQQYIVPPDMKEKEKIVGGVLTIYQFAWLGLGLLIAGLIFITLFSAMNLYGLIIAVPIGSAVGLPFAFYEKEELTLFRYIYLKLKFRKKTKALPNKRAGGEK